MQGALRAGFLLRGCIAAGDHIEVDAGAHGLVISRPLVAAVRAEARARYPRVVLHPDIQPDRRWYTSADTGELRNLVRPIVYRDGAWMVNPFA